MKTHELGTWNLWDSHGPAKSLHADLELDGPSTQLPFGCLIGVTFLGGRNASHSSHQCSKDLIVVAK